MLVLHTAMSKRKTNAKSTAEIYAYFRERDWPDIFFYKVHTMNIAAASAIEIRLFSEYL